MKSFVGLGMSVLALAVAAPSFAQVSDPESAQIMCDLTGDCASQGAGETTSVAPTSAADGTTRKARTGSTRGFTFTRQTAGGATPAAGAPAASQRQAPVQMASRSDLRPVVRPAQVGASNLNVTFISGSAVLSEPSKARLSKYAAVLASSQLSGRRLRIEGHTDASGSPAANRELSRRRAQAVADYLATQGVAANRIDVMGYGDSRLLSGVAPNSPANRRVVAVLL